MYPEVFSGITVSGIYIHEPGGLITDMLIAILCLVLLLRLHVLKDSFQKYWALFIAMIGLGGVGGALVHGFPTVLGESLFYWMWALKNVFLPLGNYFAAYVILKAAFPSQMHWLHWLIVIKMLAANVFMFYTYSFLPIVIDIALTYILVIWLSAGLSKKIAAYRYIRNAFLVAFFSGFLYILKYDIDPVWFSHKDLVHVFVLISIYMIYKAIIVRDKDYNFGRIERPSI